MLTNLTLSFAATSSKVLVTAGFSCQGKFCGPMKSQVFDLDYPDAECQPSWNRLQQNNQTTGSYSAPLVCMGVGGLLQDGPQDQIPVVCGCPDGLDRDGSQQLSACFRVDTWTQVAQMSLPGIFPYGIVVQKDPNHSALWITGGVSTILTGGKLYTTEFVYPNGTTESGPDLPRGLHGHCVVAINDTTALVIGGWLDHWTKDNRTWIIDFDTNKWSSGPDLNQGRIESNCGLIKDRVTGDPLIVVTGGIGSNLSTEIWNIRSNQMWIIGPNLPELFGGGASIVTDDGISFIVIGGASMNWDSRRSIFQFQCSSMECQWSKMNQKLMETGWSYNAFLIPDSLTTCNDTR